MVQPRTQRACHMDSARAIRARVDHFPGPCICIYRSAPGFDGNLCLEPASERWLLQAPAASCAGRGGFVCRFPRGRLVDSPACDRDVSTGTVCRRPDRAALSQWRQATACVVVTPPDTVHGQRFNNNQVLLWAWPLATYCFLRAFETRAIVWAAATGAATALAMLGKYYSIYLVAALVVAAL